MNEEDNKYPFSGDIPSLKPEDSRRSDSGFLSETDQDADDSPLQTLSGIPNTPFQTSPSFLTYLLIFLVLIFVTLLFAIFKEKAPPVSLPAVKIEEVIIDSSSPLISEEDKPFLKNIAGFIAVQDKRIEFSDLYIRLRKTVKGSLPEGLVKSREEMKTLEILFFKEDLTPDQKSSLETVYSLRNETLKAVGQSPVLLLSLYYPSYIRTCSAENIFAVGIDIPRTNEIALTKDYDFGGKLSFNPNSLSEGEAFSSSCNVLKAGNKFSFNFKSSKAVQSTLPGQDPLRITWNINTSGEIYRFKTLGKIEYLESVDSLALWNNNTGELQIGFFDKKLTFKDMYLFKQQQSLFSHPGNKPYILGKMNLPAGSRRVSDRLVNEGYSLEFYGTRGKGTFPNGSRVLKYSYPAGKTPDTLTGTLAIKKRILGRFEGQKLFPTKKGIFEVNWILPFNARVVVIP